MPGDPGKQEKCREARARKFRWGCYIVSTLLWQKYPQSCQPIVRTFWLIQSRGAMGPNLGNNCTLRRILATGMIVTECSAGHEKHRLTSEHGRPSAIPNLPTLASHHLQILEKIERPRAKKIPQDVPSAYPKARPRRTRRMLMGFHKSGPVRLLLAPSRRFPEIVQTQSQSRNRQENRPHPVRSSRLKSKRQKVHISTVVRQLEDAIDDDDDMDLMCRPLPKKRATRVVVVDSDHDESPEIVPTQPQPSEKNKRQATSGSGADTSPHPSDEEDIEIPSCSQQRTTIPIRRWVLLTRRTSLARRPMICSARPSRVSSDSDSDSGPSMRGALSGMKAAHERLPALVKPSPTTKVNDPLSLHRRRSKNHIQGWTSPTQNFCGSFLGTSAHIGTTKAYREIGSPTCAGVNNGLQLRIIGAN
ncbi:hypothetical protein B0H14DRAFT_3645650 [Mycena olivaceomarginata]|nr:hypothetical protein B0H14DRAFT_3645650 [Mycena olivaceomarginata]